ncbi:MAG: hypothetical protein ACREKH_14545, partial [Candidatus Rokuibacteriota bacterium]
MLDLRRIREQPEAVARALVDKGGADLIEEILAKDAERRRVIKEAEDLKALRNRASEAIGQARRRGEDAAPEQSRMREVGERIKALDADVKAVDDAIEALLEQVPNVPHPSVPPGKSDADNVEVRRWGTPREFAFAPKPHEEVGEALGLLDMDRAVKIAKSRFAVMWGPLARLERALAQLMLDVQTQEHGYTEVWVPPPRERRDDAQDRAAAEVRGGPVQDGRGRRGAHAVPDPHVRGPVERASRRRGPARANPATPLHGLHPQP